MTKYYIEKASLIGFLKEISAAQTAANRFINVTVKPYRGKKYDAATTVVVVIG